MNRILLALILLAPLSWAQTFQVDPPPIPIKVVCPSGLATASGNTYTCPGGVVPQCPSPPGSGPCGGPTPPPGSIYLGDLVFDGAPVDTQGVNSKTTFVYGRIVIPNAPGQKVSVTAYAGASGAGYKQMVISKSVGDFVGTPGSGAQGVTVTVYMAIGTPQMGSMTVQPGDIFFVNMRYQFMGQPTCAPGQMCDFSVRSYPPS